MTRSTLSITVFTTGAAVLALEILASRYMLPAFGTSLFIWGAVLSVTLLSLAIGYRWGGKLADRLPTPHQRLVLHVLFSAGWIGAVPLWGAPLLRFGLWTGALLGPLVATIALFAVPLTLLATVVPLGFGSALKSKASTPGKTMGDLFAISTAGSVVGALATAYVSVPVLGLSHSFFAVGVLLLVVVFPTLWKGLHTNWGIAVLALLIMSRLLPAEIRGEPRFLPGVRLLQRFDTRYAQIDVLADERDQSRILLLDGASQNWVAGDDWSESQFEYIPCLLHYLRFYGPRSPERALVLGLGAGTLVRELHELGYRLDVVELDPVVYEAARRYFGFPDGIAAIHFGDARPFLDQAVNEEQKFDLVVVDVSGGGHHPEHVYNRDAYERIRRLLKPDGMMAANMVVFTHSPEDKAARHSIATVASIYPFFDAIDLYPNARYRGQISQLLLLGRLESRPLAPTIAQHKRMLSESGLRPLTDDWNPLALWSIRASARWHRNIRDWLGDAAFLR